MSARSRAVVGRGAVTRLTIRTRITLLVAAMAGAIALFIFLYFPVRLEEQALMAIRSKAESMAAMGAYAASAGVYFEDELAVSEAIAALEQSPDVRFVTVRDTSGLVIAAYSDTAASAGRQAAGSIYRLEAPVRYGAEVIGSLELGLSLDAVRQEVDRSRANVAALSGLILCFGLAGAQMLARLSLLPLARMVRVVDRVSSGDLTERTEIRANDEVGHLARAFDRMVDRLEQAYGDLRAVNRDLEARVQARTAELERQIEERRRAEDALRESEHQFRAMFEAAAIGIALVDSGGRILAVNPALSAMAGAPRDELLATPIDELLFTEDATGPWTSLREVVDGVREEVAEDVRCRTTAGELLWGHAAASAVRDRGGELQFAIVTIEDTTEQKALEDRLTQSQKLEAVGRLAGGIAHDFNNLLTTINGLTDLVIAENELSESAHGDLVEIRKAGSRAADLTGQLLAFSRRQVVQPRALELNALLTDVASMLRRLIGEDVELVLTLDATLPTLHADPGQLTQVVMNLVVNARDAMPRGGRLEIGTASVDLDAAQAARFGAALPGPYVRLEVSDTGYGMDEATRRRVFEPFFTTKGLSKGTGLGLATVYGIVQQSGGCIGVESELGRGSRFSIYLPVPAAGADAAAQSDPTGDSAGDETVLVVEDEEAVRALIARVLRRRGYTVLEASSGADAIRVASDRSRRIDAVVTDVIMPEMSGPDMMRALTDIRRHLPVLYISGYTHDEVLHHGIAQDEVSFLQKPMSPGTLAAKVREVLDNRALQPSA